MPLELIRDTFFLASVKIGKFRGRYLPLFGSKVPNSNCAKATYNGDTELQGSV